MDAITFATACKKYFGLKPGQTLIDFAHELKSLTLADKAEMAPMLEKALGQPVTV